MGWIIFALNTSFAPKNIMLDPTRGQNGPFQVAVGGLGDETGGVKIFFGFGLIILLD